MAVKNHNTRSVRGTIRHPLFWVSSLFHMGAMLALFVTLPKICGFIYFLWIAAQVLFSLILANTGPAQEKNFLYFVFSIFSCGLPFILQYIVYTGRKNTASESVPLMIVLAVYALTVCGLPAVWLFCNLRYFFLTLAANGVLTLWILLQKQDAHYKIFWILFVFALPGTGLLLYVFSCKQLYFFTFRSRCKRFDGRRGEHGKGLACNAASLCPPADAVEPSNGLHYFSSGTEFFEDVTCKLRAAKKYIYLELFIYDEGTLAEEIFGILNEKAAQGVNVYVLYDELGGYEWLRSKRFKAAARAGVHLRAFNPLPPFINLNINYRDHRKIIVIDGETAYTGGINIADEYIDAKHVYGRWKDCGVRMDGAAGKGLVYLFERTWFALSKEDLGRSAEVSAQDGACTIFGDGVEYSTHVCKDVYLHLINSARHSIKIMTPYFMPGREIVTALTQAAQRNVEVTICLPNVPDKFYVHFVSRLNADRCLKKGVRIQYMKGGFLHSKILLCDGTACLCTANFDFRSLFLQEECGMISSEREFVRRIEEDFAELQEGSIIAEEQNTLSKRHKFKTIVAYCYDLISYWF